MTTDLPGVVSGTLAVIVLRTPDVVHLAAPRVGAVCTVKLWHSI